MADNAPLPDNTASAPPPPPRRNAPPTANWGVGGRSFSARGYAPGRGGGRGGGGRGAFYGVGPPPPPRGARPGTTPLADVPVGTECTGVVVTVRESFGFIR